MMDLKKTVTIDRAKFHIRSMNGREQMAFYGGALTAEDVSPDKWYNLVAACLEGWEDALNLREEPMGAFEESKVNYLDYATVHSLASEIMLLSAPDSDAKKTLLESPPSEITQASSSADGAPV